MREKEFSCQWEIDDPRCTTVSLIRDALDSLDDYLTERDHCRVGFPIFRRVGIDLHAETLITERSAA